MIYHNSQEEYYRSPLGALETGSDITLRIKVPDKINNVYVYYWTESTGNVKVQMSLFEKLDGYGVYSAKINVGMKPQLLWYNFSFEEEEFFMGIMKMD
jgi:hypothetical protein